METGLLTLSTFVAGTVGVFGLFSVATDVLLKDRTRINERLQNEFRAAMREQVERSTMFKSMRDQGGDVRVETLNLAERIQALIEQSGVGIPLEQIAATSCSLALVSLTATLVLGLHWSIAVGVAAGVLLVPVVYLMMRRKARLQQLRDQLPEAFELMSRAVRAGQTMLGALQLASTQCKPPLSVEFAYCCEQQNLGLPQEVIFRDLARRNDVIELQMFVVALLVQRQCGGNPVEILNNLSQMIRNRIKLQGRVRALTSEGRMQAVVLTVLPVVAFAAIFLLNRSYAQTLLDRPLLLAGILVAQVVGAVWIRKIVNFEY